MKHPRAIELLLVTLGFMLVEAGGAERLPLPTRGVADLPPLVPTVITAGGQRLLLAETDVTLRWDAGRQQLVCNRPGWWVINYPLHKIGGLPPLSEEAIAQQVFGHPRAELRNWYVQTGGAPAPEPSAPTGPAPIELTPNPTLVVDGSGGADSLNTISAAVAKAQPGTTIRVLPGVYRESVSIKTSGTADQPIRLEGQRRADGQMPIVTGNDPFPANAWTKVEGQPNVWRADLFSGHLGTVALDGNALLERSCPDELQPGEFCLNRGSKQFLDLKSGGEADPESDAPGWQRVEADAEGFLELGEKAGNAVVWLSSWVWIPPKQQEGVVWDPRFPEPITGRLEVGGAFRAARETGSSLKAQVNKYRIWVNGERLPSVVRSTPEHLAVNGPRPNRNYGKSDQWEGFPLKEGWNHLVLQLDTTTRPADHKLRFGLPAGVKEAVTSAEHPVDRTKPTEAQPQAYVSSATVSDPTPAQPDLGVYVRLPGEQDPNTADLDLSARGSTLVDVEADFVEVRGFEIRDGCQFQQRPQVQLTGEGLLLEGCLVRDSEVRGIGFTCQKDQNAAPMVMRGNWVLNPGNTGFGGAGSSDSLTAENQNDLVPGRSPVLLEHNRVVNNNWAAYPPFWESGAMKCFRLTGAVFRYNTLLGGSGPGIWLDWEHYGNRLEGNLSVGGWAFTTGIEASPGPNLVCNNLTVDLRPGNVWFRWAHLAWSSDRVWVISNTVDGRWNQTPTWQNKRGADGIFLWEGGDDRHTHWVPLTNRQQAQLNNVVVGCTRAVRHRDADTCGGNATDTGEGADPLGVEPGLVAPDRLDYRLAPDSPLRAGGVSNRLTRLVTHDFNGLLRFPADGAPRGAFRAEPPSAAAGTTKLELELTSSQLERR